MHVWRFILAVTAMLPLAACESSGHIFGEPDSELCQHYNNCDDGCKMYGNCGHGDE